MPHAPRKEEISLTYTGPGRIANGIPVHLSSTLTEDEAPEPHAAILIRIDPQVR